MWTVSSAAQSWSPLGNRLQRDGRMGRLTVSPPDVNWKAPFSVLFHLGASAPGG